MLPPPCTPSHTAGPTPQTSVILITTGIVLATLSAPPKPTSPTSPPRNPAGSRNALAGSTDVLSDALQYVLGIALLGAALVVSAFMGLWQEGTYKVYGAEWREGLFYTVSGERWGGSGRYSERARAGLADTWSRCLLPNPHLLCWEVHGLGGNSAISRFDHGYPLSFIDALELILPFYTTQHAMSLPFFLPLLPSFSSSIALFSASPPLRLSLLPSLSTPVRNLLGAPKWLDVLPNKYPQEGEYGSSWALAIPAAWAALAANVVTQGLCIRGVNRLTAVSLIACRAAFCK